MRDVRIFRGKRGTCSGYQRINGWSIAFIRDRAAAPDMYYRNAAEILFQIETLERGRQVLGDRQNGDRGRY